MDNKKFIQTLGFEPKENTTGIFIKTYAKNGKYSIEVDFEKETINYGKKIIAESKTTQNHAQAENWIVLECVDRLLEKGYKPESITLEKTWPTGHGTSGRLDILIKNKGLTYLMIECKTWGTEYEKELKALNKNGGQLFTYFQQDKYAEVIMLYTSALDGKNVKYRNDIIKIEEHYRHAGNVLDVYERWNKITLENGIFDDWVKPYCFENKRIIKKELIPLDKEASTALFHNFLSILRKHSVSDKGNAFNVIFDLFLSKLWDEKKEDDEEMDFQWRENDDDPVSFQYRLLDLYRAGMDDFLRKEVFGVKDSDFKANTPEELKNIKKKILMLDKVFNIKGVIDEDSFDANHRVLKEVVELLQQYKIRYPRKQQHLSDFFERLLTTGLKQEAGQFFTPPPITRFIVRSLPVKEVLISHIDQKSPTLPAVIDYAVGSGHFLTEIMEEYQATINKLDITSFKTDAKKKVTAWRADEYDWAAQYIYGVDVDYRLVKVAKVGCYFYGDGLAQVIHGNGLDNFKNSKSYRGLLKDNEDKPQFQFVLSNPPYSVSSFKTTMRAIDAEQDFKLYDRLTDRSSEIECLFIERTAHLLKEGGIAAIVLPSSILSNTGIYTDAREIILKSFDIIAITELGSGTFMATGTNTVTLFLRRRADNIATDVQASVAKALADKKDLSIKGIEKPISKYIAHVWEGIKWSDYKTLLSGKPNQAIQDHELYIEYAKKLKAKTSKALQEEILAVEADKLTHFILAYGQEVVLVKTGDKKKEKKFLGYEFSNRRGSEGMNPINRSGTIDDCTQLYDTTRYDNPSKASTYIHHAFSGGKALSIPTELKENISYQPLVDMMTYDRTDFEKNISLSLKKKVKIESKWEIISIGNSVTPIDGNTTKVATSEILQDGELPVITQEENELISGYSNSTKSITDFPLVLFGDHSCTFKYIDFEFVRGADGTVLLKPNDSFNPKYFFYVLNILCPNMIENIGKYERHFKYLKEIKIPLPPKATQQKIVAEIQKLEKQEQHAISDIDKAKKEISVIKNLVFNKKTKEKLGNLTTLITKGSSPTWQGISYVSKPGILFVTSENVREGYIDLTKSKYLEEKFNEIQARSILKKGDVLLNIVGASIGRAALFEIDKPSNINQAVAVIRCKINDLLPEFLNHLLNSTQIIEMYSSMKKEVARANLSLQNVSDIKIPLPPINEQKKIVDAIQKIEDKISKLQEQLHTIPASKEAVLKKYL